MPHPGPPNNPLSSRFSAPASSKKLVVRSPALRQYARMLRLTRQERKVLLVALLLLLAGWVVKFYRVAHPPDRWKTPAETPTDAYGQF
jgi:hypothetical protein